jgi:hypothetical protein
MTSSLKAGLHYFAIVFFAGFILGVLRVTTIAPWLGKTAAVAIELPLMLLISWIASRISVDRYEIAYRVSPRLAMGLVAFATLMVAEAGLSTLGFDRTLAEHFALYRTPAATLGLSAQVVFALCPLVQCRFRRTRKQAPQALPQ